jgi:hypothetical protein
VAVVRLLRPLIPLVLLGCVAAAAAPASAEVECEGIDNCTTQQGPWIAVPVKTAPDSWQAAWTGQCTGDAQIAGSDWNSANPNSLDIFVEQTTKDPIYDESDLLLLVAANRGTTARSFQPLLGCIPAQAASGRAAAGRNAVLRVSAHRLSPGDRVAFTHRCRRGERLMKSGSSVGFFQRGLRPGASSPGSRSGTGSAAAGRAWRSGRGRGQATTSASSSRSTCTAAADVALSLSRVSPRPS